MREIIPPISVKFEGEWAEGREEFKKDVEDTTPYGEWTEYGFTTGPLGILRVDNTRLFHEKVMLILPGPLAFVGGKSADPVVIETPLKRGIPMRVEIEGKTLAIISAEKP